MNQPNEFRYRWSILILAMLTYGATTGAERMCMPVLFKEIASDLGLSMVAIGAIWGMDPLAGVFVGLPGGLLADRFGIKNTLVVLCLLCGLFGALRGLSNNFISLAATMFLFGLAVAMVPSVVPKVTAIWFSGRYLGLTNALINVAWSIGAMIGTMFSATVLSPLLGSWRVVLFLFGLPALMISLLWLWTGRKGMAIDLAVTDVRGVSFKQALFHVIRLKGVWMIGLISLTQWGANTGLIGYLPLYLRAIGWSPTLADSAITILIGVSCVGTIPTIYLSDRLESIKGVLFFTILIMTVSLGLLSMIHGAALWGLLVLVSVFRSGSSALLIVLTIKMKEVGSAYGGTAIGLASTMGMLGAFLAPPLGNSLTKVGLGCPFIFWSFLSVLALPVIFFIKE